MKHNKSLVILAITPEKLRKLLQESDLRHKDIHFLAPVLGAKEDVKSFLEQQRQSEVPSDVWDLAEV